MTENEEEEEFMRRKFWALLMTIMMIATMVPASAFAVEEHYNGPQKLDH